MGNAFIAVSDDGTAASWNPAGLSQLRRPELSVVAVCAEIKFGLVTFTATPGTEAPCVSVTVPSIEPVVDVWPSALPANSAKDISKADRPKNLKTFFIFCFPFL